MVNKSLFLFAAAGLCAGLSGCGNAPGAAGPSGAASAPSPAYGFVSRPNTAVSNAAAADANSQNPILPDPSKTPGDALAVTAGDVCQPGYAHAVRNVPIDVKRQVYQSYGIVHHTRGQFEVDHLISLELGGSNSVKNLWPESYQTQPWNAHVKDQLEDRLHDDVCSGQMQLDDAQRAISGNWITAYQREFHTKVPLTTTQYGKSSGKRHHRHRGDELVRAADETPDMSTGAAGDANAPQNVAYPDPAAAAPVPIAPLPTATPASGAGAVWVNPRSHKYFLPGSRYYGKTKQGQYMTQAAAQAAGYTAANSE